MSKENFMQALFLNAPNKIPRTEYSIDCHWDLLKVVTGIDTDIKENRGDAVKSFRKKWDYGFIFGTTVHKETLAQRGGRVTDMGHAVYLSDGSDFDNKIQCPFETPEDVLELDPCEEYGEYDQGELISRFEAEHAAQLKDFNYAARMGGTYSTLFSGLIDILGYDMLLTTIAMYEKEFGKVIEGYYNWIKQFFDAYAKTNNPIMMVHDDLCWTEGPPVHPQWYRKYIFPYLKKLIEPVKAAGKKVMFTSDGTIDVFFHDIVDLNVDMVLMEPTSDIREFARRYGNRCGMVGGMDCRTIMRGDKKQIEEEMCSLLEFAKQYPGFVLSTGNHIPPDVPLEHCLFYNEMYEKYAYRR